MLLVYVLLVLCITCCEGKDVPVKIGLMQPATVVDRKFLSIAITSGRIHKRRGYRDLASEKLLALAKGLTPSGTTPAIYLRYGGKSADHTIFDPIGKSTDHTIFDPTMYILNVTELNLLCKFVGNLGWDLIFGLNVLLRNNDGSWNPSNGLELINYLNKKNISIHYELGNEPDLYPRHLNITIAPQQLADDFRLLHHLLRKTTVGKSMLIGPDIATLTRYNYFAEFLSNVSEHVLDAVTFHHYYSSSEHVNVKNFTHIKYLDRFLTKSLQAFHIIKSSFSTFPHPPVWVGETSSTYGGGCPGIGTSFAAGFLWLDKLGIAAQLNISVVIRQNLYSGHYALLNNRDLEPTPDYWSTLLYKRLVGPVVLNINDYLEYDREVRVYAHCTNRFVGHGYGSSPVLIVLNLNPVENANIKFAMHGWGDLIADLYLFQPAYGNLNDQHVTLNGVLLKMLDDTTLPSLTPVRVAQPYVIPPLTYGFLVVLNSTVPACTKY